MFEIFLTVNTFKKTLLIIINNMFFFSILRAKYTSYSTQRHIQRLKNETTLKESK